MVYKNINMAGPSALYGVRASFRFQIRAMTIPYRKPHLTLDQQITLLQSRGMAVQDIPKAKHYLQRLGYYRLSGYWFPLRRSKTGNNGVTVLDDFRLRTHSLR